MAIKKYTSGAWVPTTYRRYGTETDTITSLPAQIIGDGQPITSCQVSGNTVQNGTPTPSDPVDVAGCGEKTAQLFEDKIASCSIDASGRLISNPDFDMYLAKVEQGETYTASSQITGGFFATKPVIGSTSYNGQSMAFALPTVTAPITGYMTFRVNSGGVAPMFNLGSTAMPYEPYGYKLPLTVNGTEYPIYLGQVPTTRRIKKLVLTGEENWTITSNGVLRIGLSRQLRPSTPLCTHYLGSNSTAWANLPDKSVTVSIAGYLAILDTTYTTVADFKSYLAAQYTAGTPVTVWYVLAEPETAIVNEPLHKIGDYADTVSATNIPTTGTPENFDVGTTLKPSEVQLTYHGWHEHTDTKYTQGE